MRRNLTLAGIGALMLVASANGAAINYGDKIASSIVYHQVTEDSTTDPTPLFGNPTVAGDALLFNPVSFGASAANGTLDITDGTLTTVIEAKPNQAITAVNLAEAGDYTLGGTGTIATSASVAAPYFIRIVEANGLAITPILINGNLAFSPSGGTYDLINDPGVGTIWTGSANIDIAGALAAANVQGVATKVTLTLDNTLLALSEQGTISFIKKKETDGITITTITPEPASLASLLLVGTMLGRRRRH